MPNDINQTWGITFMQKYAPANYQEYQDILAGKKTFGTQKKDILKRGVQKKDNGPNDQTQNYLNKVLPSLIWRNKMIYTATGMFPILSIVLNFEMNDK